MELKFKDVDGHKVAELHARYLGIITPDESKELRGRLEELSKELKPGTLVCLDLDHIDYMNSSALGVIVDIFTKYQSAGIRFVLFNLNAGVHKVIEMMGLDRILHIARDEQDALAFNFTNPRNGSLNPRENFERLHDQDEPPRA